VWLILKRLVSKCPSEGYEWECSTNGEAAGSKMGAEMEVLSRLDPEDPADPQLAK